MRADSHPDFQSANVGQARVSTGNGNRNSPEYMHLSFTDARAFSPPTHTIPMSDGERKLPSIG